MARVYVALGSNIGDRRTHLNEALVLLQRVGLVLKCSPYLETEHVGDGSNHPPYLNAVAEIETPLPPEPLLNALLSIEKEKGRVRTGEVSPRTLDLDIIAYEDRVINTQGLHIPHPRMHVREFVLGPLVSLNPGWRHPILNKTSKELLDLLRTPERAAV